MEDIFEIVTLNGLLSVEQIEELLHKLGRHVEFELLDLNGLIDDKLEEEFVDTLEVGPRRVHLLFLIDTSLRKVQLVLIDTREWAEDILLNHLHGLVHVGNDGADYVFLVAEHRLKFLDGIKALSLNKSKIGKGEIFVRGFDRTNEMGVEDSSQSTKRITYLALHVFLLVLVVIGLHTHLKLLDVQLLRVLVYMKDGQHICA